MKAVAFILSAALVAGSAFAKLPDPSPEAKEKAALTKAENAHKDKIAAYQVCQSQDKTAKRYLATPAGKGKKTTGGAPCADPGKFVPPVTVAAAPAAAPAPAPAPAAAAPAAAPAAAAKPVVAAPVKK
ncbi:MAG: formate dehydrogenase [Sulfuritalea sp.]|jgi:hypothetical protein|nr:formate dehydrogenase [Sulfuritalea sp.]